MASNSFNWVEVKTGLKTLTKRNALVAVIFNCVYLYSQNMKNGIRPLVAQMDMGMTPTEVTICTTLFSIVSLLCAAPIGALIDRKRDTIKKALIIANVARAAIYLLLYGAAANKYMVFAAYAIDGIVWCACGILLPALLAVTVDRKAMGSAYAVYFGFANFITGSAQSNGQILYEQFGAFTSCAASAAVAMLGTVVLLFIDYNDLSRSLKAEIASGKYKPKERKRGLSGFFDGFSWAAFPFALAYGLTCIWGTVKGNFMGVYMNELGYDWLATQTIARSVYGIFTIFIGVLCDIVSPIILSIISLIGMAVGAYIIGDGASESMVNLGVWFITMFAVYQTVLRIAAMKLLPYSKQGSVQSTMTILANICNTFGPLPLAYLAGIYGYSIAFKGSTVLTTIALICFICAMLYNKSRQRKEDGDKLPGA